MKSTKTGQLIRWLKRMNPSFDFYEFFKEAYFLKYRRIDELVVRYDWIRCDIYDSIPSYVRHSAVKKLYLEHCIDGGMASATVLSLQGPR